VVRIHPGLPIFKKPCRKAGFFCGAALAFDVIGALVICNDATAPSPPVDRFFRAEGPQRGARSIMPAYGVCDFICRDPDDSIRTMRKTAL
jgi:hypothetical protein